jgi:hypothetical protein
VMNCFTNICKSFIKTKNPNNFLSRSGFFILVFFIYYPNIWSELINVCTPLPLSLYDGFKLSDIVVNKFFIFLISIYKYTKVLFNSKFLKINL